MRRRRTTLIKTPINFLNGLLMEPPFNELLYQRQIQDSLRRRKRGLHCTSPFAATAPFGKFGFGLSSSELVGVSAGKSPYLRLVWAYLQCHRHVHFPSCATDLIWVM